MRKAVALVVATQCLMAGWLLRLSIPESPANVVEPARQLPSPRVAQDDMSAEIEELRHRLAELEAKRESKAEIREPLVAETTPPVSDPIQTPINPRPLEARGSDPTNWVALEGFVNRWDGRDSEEDGTLLALMSPTELVTRFGPPTQVFHGGNCSAWIYDSLERNNEDNPLTSVIFTLSHGSVSSVKRETRP